MKKYFLLSLVALFLTVPAWATWEFANGTTASSTNPEITDGNWTLYLYSKSKVKYKSHAGGSTVLDLSGVQADTGLTITMLDNEAFKDNTVITELICPPTCTTFWTKSFNSCKTIQKIGIPSDFKTFNDNNMFDSATALKTIYILGTTPEIGTVHLPKAITDIKGLMFSGCSSIEKVIAPGVVSIGDRAFYNCSSLTTVEISPSLSTMTSSQNFRGCSALTTVYPAGTTPVVGTVLLPNTLTEISGWGAFFECKSIEHVIARGVTDVAHQSFRGCTSLVSVEFSPNLAYLRTNGAYSDNTPFYNCTSLTTFSPAVWGSVTIGAGTFRNCNSLTTYLDLSKSGITEIPSMWAAYTSLDGVTFPAGLTAFTGDQNFRELKKGAKFRFLGNRPTVSTSGDKSPFYTTGKNNTSQRHVFIVDAATYPAWTNGTDFVAMADIDSNNDTKNAFSASSADYPATKYPREINSEDVLGATIWGSGSGRYNWVVQYVDHSTFAVTWMNGDAEFDSTTVATGTAPTAPDGTPTKDSTAEFDYTFIGWNTDPDATTALDLSQLSLTANTTFYAIYSAATRSYEITWMLDADTLIDTTTVLYGATPVHADASKPATAEYSYEFLGWSTDGSTVLASIPAVTGDATYIAVFQQHDAATTATISWFDEDGSTPLDPETTTVEKGAKPTHAEPAKAATVDTAYTFAGWTQVGGDGTVVYTTANLPAASADVAYKAVYSSATRKYTITFTDYDGTTILKTAEIEYNSAATVVEAAKPADPVRAATAEYTYAFSGWTPAFADVTGDATYTAQYTATPNEYTATFVDEDGTTVLKEATTYAYGAPVVKPDDPTKEGYTFAGWAVGGAVVDVTTMPAADTVYAATYTKNTYTITWKNANGATLSTTTVEHGAMPAYGGTAPSLSNTPKLGYTFTGWTPEIVAATEATTYTAAYAVTFLSPMTIALDSAAYDMGTGEATVVTEVGNTNATATTTAEATAQFKTTSVTGEATIDGTTVTSVFDNFASGRGYEWTITATQTYGAEYSGASESASIKGRTYARAAKSWFGNDDVNWNEGAFAPTAQSGSGAQVRLHSTVTFPAILPRVLPDAGAAVVGITAYQPNAGVAPRYYAWNGSQWVKLVGVAPKSGVEVRLLGVVDFARKDGPAVAWYADGFQLTTEEGDWEVPLAGGTKLTSFGLVGDLSVGSLSGDYDVGGQGFTLLVR